ncbi:hypothetical protein ACX8XP_06270 [Calditrichota bacterium LG25]
MRRPYDNDHDHNHNTVGWMRRPYDNDNNHHNTVGWMRRPYRIRPSTFFFAFLKNNCYYP